MVIKGNIPVVEEWRRVVWREISTNTEADFQEKKKINRVCYAYNVSGKYQQ